MSGAFRYQVDTNLVLLGFFVALFSAGIGIGGGTLLVSALVSVSGLDFKQAAGISLSTIIPISLVGSISHFIFIPEISHPGYYCVFIPSCLLGTILGGQIVQRKQNRWLKGAFSLFLLVISIRMLKIFDFPFLVYNGLDTILLSNEWLLMIPIGVLIGTIAISLGIGCGLLIVPFFVILLDIDMHEAITLSLTTMFFLSISATLVNNKLKTLDIASFRILFIPALIGALVGAVISSHLPALFLKKLFGIFLFGMACNYILELVLPRWIVIGNNICKKYKKV